MKKRTGAILILCASLVITNAWWAINAIDSGITRTYQEASMQDTQQALSQALAIIKASGAPKATRAQIIEAAQKAWSAGEPFEKDGYLWVGRLGLRFDRSGRLIDITQ